MAAMMLGLEDAAIQLEDPFRFFAYGEGGAVRQGSPGASPRAVCLAAVGCARVRPAAAAAGDACCLQWREAETRI